MAETNVTETSAARRIFPDDGDRLMTIDETAARLRTSRGVVGKLLKKRVIIPIAVGNHKYIRKYTLNNFLANIEGQDLQQIAQG